MIKKLLIAAVILSACATAGSGDAPDADSTDSNPGTTTRVDTGTLAADDVSAGSSETTAAFEDEPTTTTVSNGGLADDDVTQQPEQSPPATRPEQDTPGETVPDDTATASTGEVPADVMASVYSAAEAYSDLDRSSMTVVRAQSVVWPDGSLGCPEPGMTYTMATVDGYWVELSAGGTTLDYRVGSKGAVKLCESSLGLAPPDGDS